MSGKTGQVGLGFYRFPSSFAGVCATNCPLPAKVLSSNALWSRKGRRQTPREVMNVSRCSRNIRKYASFCKVSKYLLLNSTCCSFSLVLVLEVSNNSILPCDFMQPIVVAMVQHLQIFQWRTFHFEKKVYNRFHERFEAGSSILLVRVGSLCRYTETSRA